MVAINIKAMGMFFSGLTFFFGDGCFFFFNKKNAFYVYDQMPLRSSYLSFPILMLYSMWVFQLHCDLKWVFLYFFQRNLHCWQFPSYIPKNFSYKWDIWILCISLLIIKNYRQRKERSSLNKQGWIFFPLFIVVRFIGLCV